MWSKQTWILVHVAEARTTRPPTVRELLARQAVKEIPRGSLLEAPQPTALRSPPVREVFPMEAGGQEPIAMDAEVLKERTVPSSGTVTDEPVIPTDLECQVRTIEVTVAQETVAPVMEEEEPTGPPPIETRTIETQRGNYATIDMRIPGSIGKVGGGGSRSDGTCARGHTTKASFGTSRDPWHDGSGAGAEGPSHHESGSPLNGKSRDSWKRTEWRPANSGRRTQKRQVDWKAAH